MFRTCCRVHYYDSIIHTGITVKVQIGKSRIDASAGTARPALIAVRHIVFDLRHFQDITSLDPHYLYDTISVYSVLCVNYRTPER